MTHENFRVSANSVALMTIAGLAILLVLVAVGSAQVVEYVYSFTGANSSAYPGLVTPSQGPDGGLYGTASGQQSGTDYGTIFELKTAGGLKQLYTFDSTSGAVPVGGVTLASDGNFYGAASSGGSASNGVLFQMALDGAYTVLHEFTGGSDGTAPQAPPIVGSDGNLYGTTLGNATTASTIYKYTRSTGMFTTLYQFDQAHGSSIFAPLIQAKDASLYGVAEFGAANGCGSIFKFSLSGTLLWFYSFPCAPGGANPIGPLLQGADGNLYGTTSQGGNIGGPGVGTVFKVNQNGAVSILYNFQSFFNGGADGSTPEAGLVQATDGKLYGAASAGGSANRGTLFQITTSGMYKQLYSFPKDAGGAVPLAAPLQDTNGLLYGTTLEGGRFGFGVVYRLNMDLAPFVALVRYAGNAGSTAQILGQGFTGTTSVTFNGVAATSFKVLTDTFMTAVVPSGATTGPVVVTTPGGALTSNKNFRIVGGTAKAIRAKSSQLVFHAAKNTN